MWNIHTGKCYCVIEPDVIDPGSTVHCGIHHLTFFPKDPQHLLFVHKCKVQQWNINGHQAGLTYDGYDVAFSPDGTQFVVCYVKSVTVQNSDSGAVVIKLHMADDANSCHCCFSPDGKLVAVLDKSFIHIWDITSSDPHPIEIFYRGHGHISTLLFSSPSSLISIDQYEFLKFW